MCMRAHSQMYSCRVWFIGNYFLPFFIHPHLPGEHWPDKDERNGPCLQVVTVLRVKPKETTQCVCYENEISSN